jgi:hypothetical protein
LSFDGTRRAAPLPNSVRGSALMLPSDIGGNSSAQLSSTFVCARGLRGK